MDRVNSVLQPTENALLSHIAMVTNLGDLAALRSDWTDLETRCHDSLSVFQSFDWINEWSQVYANPGSREPVELKILLGRRNNRLVFVLPLMLRRIQGVKVLSILTDPHAQYGDILCDRSENAGQWMSAALEFCQAFIAADILYIRHVRSDSALAPFAKQHLVDAHFNDQAPYLDLTTFKSAPDYDARYSSTQKKRRKKIRKHLQDLGSVSFSVLDDQAAADVAIASAVAEKDIWLKDRGRYNRIMSCPRHVDFLRRLARLSGAPVKLVVTKLEAGGKPVSWDISFRYHDTNYCYITSHVNALNDLSPGRLHMDQSQRLSLADGMKKFDLMVPNDPHKDSWCSGKMPVNDYYSAFTAKGRLFGAAYLGWLRPLMRKVYYKLPPKALAALRPFIS